MSALLRGCCRYAFVGLVLLPAAPADADSDETLQALAERYWDARMERYPTRATALGDYRFNDRLEDLSEAGRTRWKGTLNNLLSRLRKLRSARLSHEDGLTRDLLEREIRDALLRTECFGQFLPLDPLWGPHIRLPLILVSQPFRNLEDFRAYIARLRDFPKQVGDMIDNMRRGMALGIVSPRVIVKKVAPQIRAHVVSRAALSEFYAPATEASTLSDVDRAAAVQQLTDAIMSDVVPAYLRLLAFVEDEYLPVSRSTVGLGSLANGDKVYEALAYLSTTVRTAPGHIHQMGLSEVARIRGEMAKVQREIGFDGTLDEFLAHMRSDPSQRFSSPEEMLAAADAILQRTRPLLPQLFGRLPKAECVMKPIEPFRAPASPAAYYNIPPEDGSRPGYYYLNTYEARERPRFTLEALTYHEAIPGHHLQGALDQENSAIPKFRRYGSFTAYIEGWALYAEKLGYEIGGYRDPQARFGQLTFEMWRACRLVVDTGIHLQGWPRQRAIDYLAANTSLAIVDIEAEVDRYITWPGQALAYKLGELKILEIRKDAEQQLGARFDLRAFNDALLAGGAMPTDMLEKRMRAWVASQ